jgi:hypothetical protein
MIRNAAFSDCLPPRVELLLLVGPNQWRPHHGFLDAVRHRRPRRWRVVGRDFLEPVDAGNAEHASFLIDVELVALGRVDLFSVKEPDNKHDAVLSSECGLA